jgi:hypothetical protein
VHVPRKSRTPKLSAIANMIFLVFIFPSIWMISLTKGEKRDDIKTLIQAIAWMQIFLAKDARGLPKSGVLGWVCVFR